MNEAGSALYVQRLEVLARRCRDLVAMPDSQRPQYHTKVAMLEPLTAQQSDVNTEQHCEVLSLLSRMWTEIAVPSIRGVQ